MQGKGAMVIETKTARGAARSAFTISLCSVHINLIISFILLCAHIVRNVVCIGLPIFSVLRFHLPLLCL